LSISNKHANFTTAALPISIYLFLHTVTDGDENRLWNELPPASQTPES